MTIDLILTAIIGFVFGIFPAAIYIPKFLGLADPRTYGSGNPGATNVMRSGNKLAGYIVFLIDFLKGTLAVIICAYYLDPVIGTMAGLFAVLGHVFNPLLMFKGGKGVATSLGGILAIDWAVFMVAIGIWLIVYGMTKTSSLSSVGSLIVALLLSAWLYEFGTIPPTTIAGMAMIVVIRHRQNFKKLMEGQENKFK